MYLGDTANNKKQLYHIYNEVSKQILGVGTLSLKIVVDDDTIIFRAKHRRAQRSIILEQESPHLKNKVDYELSNIFKACVKEKLEETMGLYVEAILRDYDSKTQLAFTIVVLNDKPIQ